MRSTIEMKSGVGRKAKRALAEVAGGEDSGLEEWDLAGHCGEVEGLAGLNLFCGADERTPVVVTFGIRDVFGEENFNYTGRLGRVVLRVQTSSCGVEARRKDARIVEDKEVARREELRQLGKEMVGVGSRRARECEHPRCATRGGRMLRDELGWKIVVEVGDEHESSG